MYNEIYQPDTKDWEDVLLGRRIVKAELRGDDALITLDNGVRVKVDSNDGCGGCTSGWYEVTHVATVDNVITAVRTEVEDTTRDRDYAEEAYRYSLFVFTGDDKINALTVDGDDGNGYYGSGYSIRII